MKTTHFALAAGVALFALSPAMAQDAAAPAPAEAPVEAPAPAQAPAAPADAAAAPAAPAAGTPVASATHMLSGAEVRMVTRTELSSRTTRLGDRFELEVTDDVAVNGLVMIPRGSVATGEVTRVRKKGMWGRSGILETRLVSVRAGDHDIRLTGAAGDRGRSGTAATIGAVLLSPLIVAPFVGFFVTGTSAVIPANTTTVAYTSEEVPLALAIATQPEVPAAAAPEAEAAAEPVTAPAEPAPAAPAPTVIASASPQG